MYTELEMYHNLKVAPNVMEEDWTKVVESAWSHEARLSNCTNMELYSMS